LVYAILIALNQIVGLGTGKKDLEVLGGLFFDLLRGQSTLNSKCDPPRRIRPTGLRDNSPMLRMNDEIRAAKVVLVEGKVHDVGRHKGFIPREPLELNADRFANRRTSAVRTNDILGSNDLFLALWIFDFDSHFLVILLEIKHFGVELESVVGMRFTVLLDDGGELVLTAIRRKGVLHVSNVQSVIIFGESAPVDGSKSSPVTITTDLDDIFEDSNAVELRHTWRTEIRLVTISVSESLTHKRWPSECLKPRVPED
jgi:hypothetical protein